MALGRFALVLFSLMLTLVGCNDDEAQTYVPARQGSRGEACLITNDCKSGLLCIADTCISDDFALEPSAKVCVAAQCIDKTDCCRKSASEIQTCNTLQQNCSQSPGSFWCDEFAEECGECTRDCVDHTCRNTTTVEPNCTSDAECSGGGSTPFFCVQGQCRRCGDDAHCGGNGLICQSGSCVLGCARSEACGAMSQCNAGRCESRACLDNRECVALMQRPDAVCDTSTGQPNSGKCSIPCDDNAGCASLGGLYSCSSGFCVYAGCLSNAECAASQNPGQGGSLRLCLDQAEADKVDFGNFDF